MQTLNKQIYNKETRPIRVLQFGEGNFLRAFIDWFFNEFNHKANFNTNICVVQPLAFGRVKELEKQDGLYTLLLEGIQNKELISKKEIIDCLGDFINPYEEFDRYLAYAESDDLKMIISNTTEAGIALDEHDLDDTVVSNSYPGKLLSFLKRRYDHFNGDYEKGLFIVPCELIDYNGNQLRTILNTLSNLRNYDDNFIQWLNKANLYYNTLVDRIVPGYPKQQIEALEAANGYVDNNIVKGEIFHLWVIEGDPKIKEFLPLDKVNLNILVTDNVKPYKERKVKILNGSHTLMVPVAYQYGVRAVNEMMQNTTLRTFLMNFLQTEVWPTINLSQEEKEQFTNDVMERFENPTIYHELLTISLNSMTKYKTRVLPSATEYYRQTNELPKHALFSLAALFNLYSIKDGDTLLVKDNPEFIEMWTRLWANENVDEIVEEVMGLKHWEYDFDQMKGAKAYVKDALTDIRSLGMQEALYKYFNENTSN